MCSDNSPRRHEILQQLEQNNIKTLNVCGWGDNRDTLIGSCKILINIHCTDSYKIYESLRCDRWTFSEMVVVSETLINDAVNDMSQIIILESYENIVNKIIHIINNYDSYVTQLQNARDLHMDQIISNRKKNYVILLVQFLRLIEITTAFFKYCYQI